jgi:hypothetical protein
MTSLIQIGRGSRLLLLAALLISTALPATARVVHFSDGVQLPSPQVSEQDPNIRYISGGIGETSENYLLSLHKDYNLQLLFAEEKTGVYLSDVDVQITDKKGQVFLNTKADGPYLLAQLSPGRYKVSATHLGKTKTLDAVLKNEKQRKYFVYFPQEEQTNVPSSP